MITIIIILIVVSLLFSFPTKDSMHTDKVIESIGTVATEEYYQHGWWQDYTVYSKYTYQDLNIENNEYLKQMTGIDVSKLKKYIKKYEKWIDAIPDDAQDRTLADNYDFDKAIISTSDYCYINNYSYIDGEYKYDPNSFDLYFYDIESGVLYYFHNNI